MNLDKALQETKGTKKKKKTGANENTYAGGI